ncbi:MAG: ribosomal RNA small subunit methyltransferase A [Deltaproteobacteria bacterium]|nr:ribosomal RNA small subunit methyltransferase A [Deltaproteobacteria bacterium]
MTLSSPASLLKKYQIRPQKRLGQNFLIAPPTLEKIVSSLELKSDDTVVEIGPGLGVMTAMLAKRCHKVIAVEKDPRLLEIAHTEFGHIKNIEWVEGDFLEYGLKNISKIIGNIPYEITSPILFKLLDHPHFLSTVVLLMQKEVSMRIVAKPRTKDYGILSVCCQAAASCQRLFDVSAASFIPPPKVTSSVVHLQFPKSKPACSEPLSSDYRISHSFGVRSQWLADQQWFRTVVRAAFGKRRKTLRNALLGSTLGIDAAQLDRALAASTIVGTRRPETLTVQEFKILANEMLMV